MKKRLLYSAAGLLACMASSPSTAQLVSGDAFLQGKHIEVGVAGNFCLGSANTAPAGYHSLVAGATPANLGVVADPAKDGFTSGSPAFFGDFVMPGIPDEEWNLQYNGTVHRVTRASGTSTGSTITGHTYDYQKKGRTQTAFWEGNSGSLSIRQTATIDTGRMYILFTVQLRNTGSTTVNNIYYNRAINPDNETEQFGATKGDATHSKNIHQAAPGDARAGVAAIGDSMRTYFGMHTMDCRAKAYFYRDRAHSGGGVPSDIYYNTGPSGPSTLSHSLTDSVYEDSHIGLVFNLGKLAPGDSTALSFIYALSEEEAGSFSFAHTWLRDSAILLATNDTAYACDSAYVKLDILSPTPKGWTWEAAPLLHTTSGSSNTVLVTGTHTYTAVSTDSSYCGGRDTLRLTLIAFPAQKPDILRTGSLLSVGPATFNAYQWLKNGVDIPGATAASLYIADSGCYMIRTIDTNGCKNADTLCVTAKELSIAATAGPAGFIRVHPNPVAGKLFIEAPFTIHYLLKDLSGKTLVSGSTNGAIDLSGYSKGIYLLCLYNEQQQFIEVRKLIRE